MAQGAILHKKFLPAGRASRGDATEGDATPNGNGEHPFDPLAKTIHAL
jgi:hypothetical protein